MNDEKKEFWRQWAVAGMPRDKIRLAEAAWNAAVAACANLADEHGVMSDSGHPDCQGCGEEIAFALRQHLPPNDMVSGGGTPSA